MDANASDPSDLAAERSRMTGCLFASLCNQLFELLDQCPREWPSGRITKYANQPGARRPLWAAKSGLHIYSQHPPAGRGIR
jgi:hypothetical protein